VFVAEDDGEIVGRLSVARRPASREPSRRRPRPDGRASHRRRGIGTRLLEAAVELGTARGVRKLELHVFPWNTAAIALYERFGFVQEGYRKEHYRRGDDYVDAVLMAYWVERRADKAGVRPLRGRPSAEFIFAQRRRRPPASAPARRAAVAVLERGDAESSSSSWRSSRASARRTWRSRSATSTSRDLDAASASVSHAPRSCELGGGALERRARARPAPAPARRARQPRSCSRTSRSARAQLRLLLASFAARLPRPLLAGGEPRGASSTLVPRPAARSCSSRAATTGRARLPPSSLAPRRSSVRARASSSDARASSCATRALHALLLCDLVDARSNLRVSPIERLGAALLRVERRARGRDPLARSSSSAPRTRSSLALHVELSGTRSRGAPPRPRTARAQSGGPALPLCERDAAARACCNAPLGLLDELPDRTSRSAAISS
jgi:hypothetical protein